MFPSGTSHVDERGSLGEQREGKRQDSQLGRLFEQLHSTSIAARSPQAKGRIERLWGTFQDRLVSELRLAEACTLAQVNAVLQEYLPRFNAHFAVPAASPERGWQAVPSALVLDECFCVHEERVVVLDNTISSHSQRVQLLPTDQQRSWGRCKVCVHVHFDGTLAVFYQGRSRSLRCRLAPADPVQLRSSQAPGSAAGQATPQPPSKAHKPKAGHPWGYRAKAQAANRPAE